MYILYIKTFVFLYQGKKKKKVGTNSTNDNEIVDITHLGSLNFFEDQSGKIDHLIGTTNVCYN